MTVFDCKFNRRFGVEIELNTLSGNIKKLDKGQAPEGADYFAGAINSAIGADVSIHGWHLTHNNSGWVVKPDSSCGIEVCSPVLGGWFDLCEVLKVIEAFKNDKNIKADDRCSLHIHVDVSDLTIESLGNVIAHWIKIEPVIMDMFPAHRKKNKYCQLIGLSLNQEHTEHYDPATLINFLAPKYFTMNTLHYSSGKRKTIEFRFGENELCLDPFSVKCWARFLLHFVNVTSKIRIPPYKSGNPKTGLLWLDPIDTFKLLKFDQNLSPGLAQVKKWALGRLSKYGMGSSLTGIWADVVRKAAYREIEEMVKEANQEPGLYVPSEEELYGEQFCA